VAFQTLQDRREKIPSEIKMVRIPCTGRISKALLVKAFEKGADGVALVGCRTGACRYGSGTLTAQENTDDARRILKIMGVGEQRLRLATFLPDDAEGLFEFLKTFSQEIRTLGKSPVEVSEKSATKAIDVQQVARAVSKYDIFSCQDCGKCSSACPLSLTGKSFTPRAVASAMIAGDIDSPMVIEGIWSCLTCGRCYERCPRAVNFPEFVREVREIYQDAGIKAHEPHGGFFQSMMRVQGSASLNMDRWSWLPESVHLNMKSKILFFGGCAPYFDIFFRKFLGTQTLNILLDSLRLLNFFDVQPAVLSNERCCGHDLLWTGDEKGFRKLAVLNAEAIHASGAEQVVTACPECYRTLAVDYPRHGIETKFKVIHLYDFLNREIEKGAVGFKPIDAHLTFQDPCRLLQEEELKLLPRKLIGHLKPRSFREISESETGPICCGGCAWNGCDAYVKAMQVNRLKQARVSGRDMLVTACPKCQIHLKCAMEDPFLGQALSMDVKDLTSLIAQSIYWA